MNEHPEPSLLLEARRAAGPHTRLVQCVCGWGEAHAAEQIFADPAFRDLGFYGFAKPDPGTTLPPDDGSGNARNIQAIRRHFTGAA